MTETLYSFICSVEDEGYTTMPLHLDAVMRAAMLSPETQQHFNSRMDGLMERFDDRNDRTVSTMVVRLNQCIQTDQWRLEILLQGRPINFEADLGKAENDSEIRYQPWDAEAQGFHRFIISESPKTAEQMS